MIGRGAILGENLITAEVHQENVRTSKCGEEGVAVDQSMDQPTFLMVAMAHL
jgi:hypothetical protein